jgi:uracil-DNA glycosylase family 4
MGFFLNEAQIEVVKEVEKQGRSNQKKSTVLSHDHPKGCDNCPLQDTWGRISSPRIPMSGDKQADILILGPAPSQDDDLQGKLFSDSVGEFLFKQLPFRMRDRLAFASVARCAPPGNRSPSGLEMHCCSTYLEEDIAKSNIKAILLVGGTAQMRFLPEATIAHVHGIWFPVPIANKVVWAMAVMHPEVLLKSGSQRSNQWPTWQADIKRFFKQVDKKKKPVIHSIDPKDVIIVKTEEKARELLKEMKDPIGLDLETSRLKPYEHGAKIITASLSDGDITFAFPVEHPSESNDWGARLLLEVTQERTWIAHQSSFEFIWLADYAGRLNFPWVPKRFDDSMAIGRLYHNRQYVLGLDIMSRILLGVNIKNLTTVDPRRIMAFPLEEVLPYNGIDAWASARIQRLKLPVNEYNYDHIIRAQKAFAYMELIGLDVDIEVAKKLKEKWSGIAAEKEKEAQTIYEVKAFMRERQQEFNIGNPDHVGKALVDYGKMELPKTTGGKQYSTDDSVLAPLADSNPLIPIILSYREAKKHESTYIDPLFRLSERYVDGKIHASYTTMRTVTLRSSAEDPNTQNYPKRRHRELRSPIIAPPGYILAACDSGQIQARVFGMASKDAALCQSFIDHVDIHTKWLNRLLEIHPPYMDHLARQTNETDEKKIRKAGRDTIKSDFVFASFFGATADGCSSRTGIPLSKTRDLLEDFWGEYPDALKWVNARRAEYAETGGVHTLTGRFRYGMMSGNESIITPIQAGEAEFIIGALNDLSEKAFETGDINLQPRICVHDDLTFVLENDDNKIDGYIKEIAHQMTRIRYPWQIVPLTVEIKLGYSWDDLTEVAVIEGDYVR